MYTKFRRFHPPANGVSNATASRSLRKVGWRPLAPSTTYRKCPPFLVSLTYVDLEVVSTRRHAALLMLHMLHGGPPRQIRVRPHLIVRRPMDPTRRGEVLPWTPP